MAPATDWKEVIPDGEAARFEDYARRLAALQAARAGGAALDRALHAKGRGFEATLAIEPSPHADLRVGLFAEAATYRALVRYSNGSGRRGSDARPDVRGLAVKVFGVGGPKVIPGMEDATTQDFLAIRTSSLPVKNADEFFALVMAAETPALVPFKLIRALGFARGLGLVRAALKSMKPPTLPLASTAFYSAVPIAFGTAAAQYAFFPDDTTGAPSKAKSPTYLGDALAARLAAGPVTYTMKVRLFEREATTPIEDASVEWGSAWRAVGKLTLPQQQASAPRGQQVAALVEQLAFDPWHARTDLRPLGSLMRARNAAYRVSTQARGALPEPARYPDFT